MATKRPRLMPKHIASSNYPMASSGTSLKSSSYNQTTATRDPFGIQMAQEIFDFYQDDDDYSPKPYYHEEDVESDDMWHQPELPLFNVGELEDMLIARINKYEAGYRKMMISALKWHYLEEDLASNPSLKTMFDSVQLMRKLSGSKGV